MSVFRKLAAKYAALGVVVGETAKAAAQDIREELEQGFSQGRAADGQPWAPLASGGASHLRQTGAYQASLDVLAAPGVGRSLIEMRTNNAANLHARKSVQYARKSGKSWVHPARPLMPITGQPLPQKWREIIASSFADSMKEGAK